METIDITIEKPIYGTYCSIDKRKLLEAARENKMIRLTLRNIGTTLVDPREWWKTAKKVEQVVKRFKDNPMTFVYNYAPIEFKKEDHPIKSCDQLSLL